MMEPLSHLARGAESRSGKWGVQKDAITLARWLNDFIGSSFGPNGVSKILLKDSEEFSITADGVAILEGQSYRSPAQNILLETAKSQRANCGDGTKLTIILACELLNRAEALLDRGVHPNTIARGYNEGARTAIGFLNEMGKVVEVSDNQLLSDLIRTALSSRFSGSEDMQSLSSVVTDAVHAVSRRDFSSELYFDDKDIIIKGVVGGSLNDTELVRGVVIEKEVELGTVKSAKNPRIALLRTPIEIEKTEWDMQVKLSDPKRLTKLLGDESQLIRDKLEKVVSTGASVVFCERGMDPLTRHYFGEKGILAVKWISREAMRQLTKATGGVIVADIPDLSSRDLGSAELVEERDFGEKKMVVIEGCHDSKTVTILIRGPSEAVVDEARRIVTIIIRSLKNLFRDKRIVPGGGATEAELAVKLRAHATGFGGKHRAVAMAFADALDSIPVTLIRNCGGDVLTLLLPLRARHQKGEKMLGIGAERTELIDMSRHNVYEPLVVKAKAIESACEAATTILSIDGIVAAEYSEEKDTEENGKNGQPGERAATLDAIRTNISMVKAVAELIKKSLGPNGMMKLLVDNIGDTRATADGATILRYLYANHPVAKLLVETAESHSKNFGDGTKTLIVLVGELLTQGEKLINQGMQPSIITRGYRTSAKLAADVLGKSSFQLNLDDRETLSRIINAIIHQNLPQAGWDGKSNEDNARIANVILEAFTRILTSDGKLITTEFDSKKVKVVKKVGTGTLESELVDGFIVEKEVASPDMPKRVEQAKVALLDCWLGITRQTLQRETKVLIQDAKALREYLKSASTIAREIAEKVISSGARVVLTSKRMEELAKRLLTDSNIMVVEAVPNDDMESLSELTGAAIITDLNYLKKTHLGEACLVEEREIHGTKLVFLEGLPHKGCTCILVRGGTDSVVDETERTMRKVIRTLVAITKDPRIVPGGGLSELLLASELRREARKISGREQFAMEAFSSALEGIPRALLENAGFDPLEKLREARDILQALRLTSTTSEGLNEVARLMETKSPFKVSVWDPHLQKTQIILNATNIANTILKLGHIVRCRKETRKSDTVEESPLK
nr:thermosome subunit alpha [Candidatus Njordarchaeota archaeon]